MKKYFSFSLITESLISSAVMAARQNDLREQLDLDGARVAFRAIANGYNVNWGKFDFKNPEDDQRATKVHNYLDAVLRKNIWSGPKRALALDVQTLTIFRTLTICGLI
jgi:hypothetical protein